jgi:hypothetical protein
MTTVGCLQCRQWYDPSRGPHICGLVGDETARRLAERLDVFERRFHGLQVEVRSRFNALERRVHELEAQVTCEGAGLTREDQAHGIAANEPTRLEEIRASTSLTPEQGFDRKANHRRYMREWRRKRAALRNPARTPLPELL